MGNYCAHTTDCSCQSCVEYSCEEYIRYDRMVKTVMKNHREARLAFEARHDAKAQLKFRVENGILQPRPFPPAFVFTPEVEVMLTAPAAECVPKK